MVLTPEQAAAAFLGDGAACEPFHGGHINASWIVRCGGERRFLQRINGQVFADPRQVMANVTAVTAHVREVAGPVSVPELLPTLEGRPWLEDASGDVWRCTAFVDGLVRHAVTGPLDAYEAAFAFGSFARALASYEGPPLPATIAGFHDTAARVAQLEAAVAADPCARLAGARREVEELLSRRALAGVLPPRMASGTLPLRLAHNDAKIANVLFDRATGRARWVVDLDTVMPGSLLHDFGDLVRSSVARGAEDAADLQAELELFEALARGFVEGAGDVLAASEQELLEAAGRIITFEQAVRFLTDHLQGDTYYRVMRPGHNLERARAQLGLLRSLERRTAAFDALLSAALR